MDLLVLMIGLVVGILVGLMGVGGGVFLVPAMVHILRMDQHTAQGTSLFLQLPPLGLGALLTYRKKNQVDLKAGLMCAAGILVGGYFGSEWANHLNSGNLRVMFGIFLIVAAVLMGRKHDTPGSPRRTLPNANHRLVAVLIISTVVGVASGLFGVGGGVLLVPLLVGLLGFEQHVAQGTSLVALVPPTGLLAFMNYAAAGHVSWRVGLWIMPGIFLGGLAGAHFAEELTTRRLRSVLVVLVLVIGVAEAFSAL
jgi:uncharacterized membrane protein YfcA